MVLRTDPCGTPHNILHCTDETEFTVTNKPIFVYASDTIIL